MFERSNLLKYQQNCLKWGTGNQTVAEKSPLVEISAELSKMGIEQGETQ